MKVCKKCLESYEGRCCKPCKSQYMREWNAKNPDKVKKIRNKKYEKYKSQINEKNKEWAKNNKEKSNAIKKKYKEKNREKYLVQQREYANKRYEENRIELLEKRKSPEKRQIDKIWREKNRERLNKEYLRKYHEIDDLKMKHSARGKVQNALKVGALIKATECVKCGSCENIQGHHEDYTKPLEVIWLCICCHKQEHSKYSNKNLKEEHE